MKRPALEQPTLNEGVKEENDGGGVATGHQGWHLTAMKLKRTATGQIAKVRWRDANPIES